MTFPRRAAAITGVYTTVQGKKLGRTEESLKLEAINGALADSGEHHWAADGIVSPADTRAALAGHLRAVLGPSPVSRPGRTLCSCPVGF